MQNLKTELMYQLTQKLIPFWSSLADKENGGFYGYMDFDGRVDKAAVKGCILNSRILWFFSNVYMLLRDSSLRDMADHAYDFMIKHCIDEENGGIYWSVNFDGSVCEDMKHTYNQAFAIYALSSYYDISGNEQAIDTAWKIYHIIEDKCNDNKGYLEAFNRNFTPCSNEKLSENGVNAEKTMNTLLHVFEAYTELYRVTQNDEVCSRLKWIAEIFKNKVYNPQKKRQEVFFDEDWNTLIDLHSYGHDIETAWLMDKGCEITGDEKLIKNMREITAALAQEIYQRAYADHSILNECENGVDNTSRVWWVQAEAMVGFYNAYQKQPQHTEYLEALKDIWEYIKAYIIDKRDNMEWFWEVDEKHQPSHKPIAEPWKCPYHNGRMMIELINRIN